MADYSSWTSSTLTSSTASFYETCYDYSIDCSLNDAVRGLAIEASVANFWGSSALNCLTGDSTASVLFVSVLRLTSIAVNGDLYFFCEESFYGLITGLIYARRACLAMDLNETALDGLKAACTNGFAKASDAGLAAFGCWGGTGAASIRTDI